MRILKEQVWIVVLGTIVFLSTGLYLHIFPYTSELNSMGDPLSYKEAARMLFSKGIVHPYRPLGISFIMGVLVGIHPLFVTVFQFLLWIGTVLVIHKSMLLFTTAKKSFLYAILFLLFIGNIICIHLQLTETITTFLLALFSFYLLKYKKEKLGKYVPYAASILVFLVLIKPGFYYLAILFSLYALGLGIKAKISIKRFMPLILSLLLLLVNNSMVYHSYGKFKPSFIDDITLYVYLGAYSQTEIRNTSTARVQRERDEIIKSLSYVQIHKLAMEDIRFQLEYHPFVVIKYWLLNIKNNTLSGNVILHTLGIKQGKKGGDVFFYWLSLIQNVFMVLLAFLLPIIQYIKTRKLELFWIVTTLLIWYIILTSGISYYQGDRFHLVFYPIIMLQVGYCFFKKKSSYIA